MEKKILNDFCFHKPKTLEEALVLIDKYQETGLLMEGGSEVIPNMKSLVVTPTTSSRSSTSPNSTT